MRIYSIQRSARINQFDVHAQFSGLDEKFRILNNDELADALRSRLDELAEKSTAWIPELLYLFLRLSDRPAEAFNIPDLDSAIAESTTKSIDSDTINDFDSLTYENSIWNNINYAATESEGDDAISLDRTISSSSTSDSHSGDDPKVELEVLALSVTENELAARFPLPPQSPEEALVVSKEQQARHTVTESQLIRESLLMLHGLPTPVYVLSETGQMIYSRQYSVVGISETCLTDITSAYADLGTDLHTVRQYIRNIKALHLHQAFQMTLESRMSDLNIYLSLVEARVMDSGLICTLSSVLNELSGTLRHFNEVAEMLRRTRHLGGMNAPNLLLELLYDAVCLKQNLADAEGFAYTAKLFLECFLAYSRPIQEWMDFGILSRDQVFFVSREEKGIGAESFWRDEFKLIRTRERQIAAPNFLSPFALDILETGKNVNFLKRLGQATSTAVPLSGWTSCLSFSSIIDGDSPCDLAPFSAKFNLALSKLIGARYQASSMRLRQALDTKCGLQSSLDALEYIFFYRNGALTDQIVTAIFDRQDRGHSSWNDHVVLTGIFHDAFRNLPFIDPRRLRVRSYNQIRQNMALGRRSVRAFNNFMIDYPMGWSVANIIQPESMIMYQRVLRFLIQILQAKYVLEQRGQFRARAYKCHHDHDKEFRASIGLRHQLLWLTNTLLAYMTNVVLHVSMRRMRLALAKADSLNNIIAIHRDYLIRLGDQSLLSEKLATLHQAIISLLDLAVMFADEEFRWRSQIVCSNTIDTNRMPFANSNTPGYSNAKYAAESSDDDDNGDHDTEKRAFKSRQDYMSHLATIGQTCKRQHDFILAGLRGVHRTGAESCWEILADMLSPNTGETIRL